MAASIIWQSGRDVDKALISARRGFPWFSADGDTKGGLSIDASGDAGCNGALPPAFRCDELLLPGCQAYYKLAADGPLLDVGDHQVVAMKKMWAATVLRLLSAKMERSGRGMRAITNRPRAAFAFCLTGGNGENRSRGDQHQHQRRR